MLGKSGELVEREGSGCIAQPLKLSGNQIPKLVSSLRCRDGFALTAGWFCECLKGYCCIGKRFKAPGQIVSSGRQAAEKFEVITALKESGSLVERVFWILDVTELADHKCAEVPIAVSGKRGPDRFEQFGGWSQ